jgi:N-methylhydantoinase A
MLDIHTVGAGGGSIARFDAAGALRVGPESAGADPGPICYGRGTLPTVTDANVLLGRLRPENFLGGDFRLDAERTRALTRDWLREHACEWSLEQFAEGVLRVVNANMEKAIRAVSIERGYDPREFTLVAFGGAGALHACELARSLQIPRVLVPQSPGALSAYGILVSDVVKEFSRTVMLTRERIAEVETAAAELQRAAGEAFADEGWDAKHVALTTSLDLRYRGQGFELNVPYAGELESAIASFHAQHKRAYGYADEGRAVEIVNVRVRAVLPTEMPELKWSGAREDGLREPASVYFEGEWRAAAVVARSSLRERERVAGPAVITEYSATTVVPPGVSAVVDEVGNLVLEIAPG